MSKQISATELAQIVTKLLTGDSGEIDSAEAYQGFMTSIAKVVCDHCGGEVRNEAARLDDIWYVGINGNDSLPDAFGGIWREYDPEGALYDEDEIVQSLGCIVRVTGNPTDDDDQNIPGQYGIEVSLSRLVRVSSLTQSEKSEIAKSVLDCFHEHQGIEVLDDFEIISVLPNGEAIAEDAEPASTGLVSSTDHIGK